MTQSSSINNFMQMGVQTNSFEQVPIGGNSNSSKFAVSEYAQGEPQQSHQNLANLSLSQRIQSKIVKIRMQGLQQFKNVLNTNNCNESQIQIHKILKQSNPACLEKALQCAEKWIQLDRPWGQKQNKQIIENGFLNGKGNTKKIATDLVFKLFEKKPEEIQRTLLQIGLKSKTPKTLSGYLGIINQILQQFGIKDLKYLKPYIPLVINIMNNQKLPIVKTQGMNLLKSGLKWLGKDFIWPLLSELKQNMKKQLQHFWEGHDKKEIMKANRNKNGSSAPLKQNNGQKNKQKQGSTKIQSSSFQDQIDVYDISDPVQIFQKYDEKWSQSVLAVEKWSSKVSMLQQITSKSSVPKIANSEHRHITEMIRRLLGDSNFNVVLSSLRLAGTLAKGLRKNFNHSAKILFPYIMPKFRDKKTQMIDETLNALSNFNYCLNLQQIGEDIKTGLKDKSAVMKTNIAKWIISSINKRQQENNSLDRMCQFFKSNSMQTLMQSLVCDPSSEVRDFTTKLVLRLRALFGDTFYKNLNISNKSQALQPDERSQKSKGKDASTKKLKSTSKSKSSKNILQEEDDANINSNSYIIKNAKDGIDITEQLNKHMKKLNDSTNWQNRKQSAQKLIKFCTALEKQNPGCKIYSSILYDFLAILKSRICDPNKQLIRVFVCLIGGVFGLLADKEAKIHGKCFVQELIQVYSDRNQHNRKQLNKTLDKIAAAIGAETIIGCIGQLLTQQTNNNNQNSQMNVATKQYTLQYLHGCEYFLSRVEQLEGPNHLKQFKQFPKIILTGLCDKNKDLRSICQKLFKLISQRTGLELFRSFVNSKQQKLMFKNDLINFIDRFEGGIEQPSMLSNISNGSYLSTANLRQTDNILKRSPSINISKLSSKQQNENSSKIKRKLSNVTSLQSSRSKAKSNSILMGYQENSKNYASNLSFYLRDQGTKRIVEGNQQFASLQILTGQRVQRQETANKYRNNVNNHPIYQQFEVQSSLSRLVNYEQIFIKMYSSDYNKNMEAVGKLIKMCRDVALTSYIREISDLLIKWAAIKLYGGNVACSGLIDLICPVLTVLEKKKIAWTDYDIDIIIYFTRQYLFAAFYQGNDNIQPIKSIFKLCIALSSGERLIKKILGQIKSDVVQFHRHLPLCKKDGLNCSKFYKKILVTLSGYLVDYFSNDALLEEAAKIPQLNQNLQFLKLLTNKFHQGVLKQFGFKFQMQYVQNISHNNYQNPINLQKSFLNAEKTPNVNSPRNVSPGAAFFGVQKLNNSSKQKKTTPQKLSQNISSNQIKYPPPSPLTKTRLVGQSVLQPQHIVGRKQSTISTVYKNIGVEPITNRYEIDLSHFNQPSHHNPLGSNLLKLFPYNESVIHFFGTLFQPQNQNSDKITSQLSTNSNIIYGYLFNSLIKMMEMPVRQIQGPERVATFTSLVQQAIKCPSIFKNLQQQIIERSMRYTIDQLVYEDQNRANIESKLRQKGFNQFKSDIFVKGINGVMLRLLDNSYPLLLVNALLLNMIEVLLQPKHQQDTHHLHSVNKNKKIGLLIRCFIRVSSCYFNQTNYKQKQSLAYNVEQDSNCLKIHHINRFILLVREYLQIMQICDLSEFEAREERNLRNQKNNLATQNSQESVVYNLCKILRVLHRKGLLLKNYDHLKNQKSHLREQRVLSDYISFISGVNFGESPLFAQNKSSEDNYFHGPSISLDEQLKKVIQMLSKSKTFNDGIKLLKQYCQQAGPKFDYRNIFMKLNFEPVFIEKVSEQMAKVNVLSSQSSSRSLNPDIQNKLQRLKMKLQGINNEHSKSIAQRDANELDRAAAVKGNYAQNLPVSHKVNEVHTSKTRDLSTRSIDQPGSGQQNDLKRRIQQMKNKVNLSTTNKLR